MGVRARASNAFQFARARLCGESGSGARAELSSPWSRDDGDAAVGKHTLAHADTHLP